MYRRRAAGYRQRGNAPRPCAPKKQNNGPYVISLGVVRKRVNSTEGLPAETYVEIGGNSVPSLDPASIGAGPPKLLTVCCQRASIAPLSRSLTFSVSKLLSCVP